MRDTLLHKPDDEGYTFYVPWQCPLFPYILPTLKRYRGRESIRSDAVKLHRGSELCVSVLLLGVK